MHTLCLVKYEEKASLSPTPRQPKVFSSDVHRSVRSKAGIPSSQNASVGTAEMNLALSLNNNDKGIKCKKR